MVFLTPTLTSYTFTPNLSLIAGDKYIAIFTNQPDGVSLGGSGSGFAEGTLDAVFDFNYAIGDPRVPSNWICQGPDGCLGVPLAFQADFSDSLSQVPLPATLPLFATGLVGLGLLGWRRKRKAGAV
jgi:hypothetical protein